MSLTLTLIPGYTFAPGEKLSVDKLNLLGQPVIDLNGSVGTIALADGSVTTAKLVDGVLSADAVGRAKMADGYLIPSKLSAGLRFGVRAVKNLRISAGGASVTITADEAQLRDASDVPIWCSSFSATTGRLSGSVNNLDTGSFALNTWYYIYLVSDGTNKATLLSASATSPTLPGSYTYFLRVGAVRNNGSNGFDAFDQWDNIVYRDETGQLITNGTGLPAAWNMLDLSAYVPPTAKRVIGNMGFIAATTKSLRISGAASPLSARGLVTCNGATGTASNNGWNLVREFRLGLATAQQVSWSSSGDTTASTYKITVTGWELAA